MDLLSTIALDKHKRRSKTDQLNRNFMCGCGKSYLSYPALYTHIKTKHEGHYPEGTISNLISSSKKRGRPRKNGEDFVDLEKILIELDMLGGSSDAKSELVDSHLYSFILKWENYTEFNKNIAFDDAFAMYLLDVSRIVDPSNFYQIVKFIENFRNSLEKFGQNEDFGFKRLPERLEYFIQHFIPLYIPSFDRSVASSLAVHFSQWLLIKKLTDIRLMLI